jgi:glycosyl-4,4'-diaponeurosporenoate acyltransferase
MKILRSLFIKRFSFNFVIFIFLSLIITYLSNKVSKKIYNHKSWVYRTREWEKNGDFYDEKLKVKKWKKRVPELGDFVKGVFPKKYIKEYTTEYLSEYLLESCKAELTHWAIIFSALVFALWNDLWDAAAMLVISAVLNIPFIVIQRYNRPRIMKIARQKHVEIDA